MTRPLLEIERDTVCDLRWKEIESSKRIECSPVPQFHFRRLELQRRGSSYSNDCRNDRFHYICVDWWPRIHLLGAKKNRGRNAQHLDAFIRAAAAPLLIMVVVLVTELDRAQPSPKRFAHSDRNGEWDCGIASSPPLSSYLCCIPNFTNRSKRHGSLFRPFLPNLLG